MRCAESDSELRCLLRSLRAISADGRQLGDATVVEEREVAYERHLKPRHELTRLLVKAGHAEGFRVWHYFFSRRNSMIQKADPGRDSNLSGFVSLTQSTFRHSVNVSASIL